MAFVRAAGEGWARHATTGAAPSGASLSQCLFVKFASISAAYADESKRTKSEENYEITSGR
jgi:hypothetical protein